MFPKRERRMFPKWEFNERNKNIEPSQIFFGVIQLHGGARNLCLRPRITARVHHGTAALWGGAPFSTAFLRYDASLPLDSCLFRSA
jgi:hypothetical protein